MYLPKFHIQLNDSGNVFAKNRSEESFVSDFSSGLPPLKKEEEKIDPPVEKDDLKANSLSDGAKAAKPEDQKNNEAKDSEIEQAAKWLMSDEDDSDNGSGGAPATKSPDTNKQPAAPAPQPSNAIPDFETIKQKADKYEALTNSEVFKLVDSFASSGEKDINKFISKIAGDDVSSKSFEEIYDLHLRNLGMSNESREKLIAKFNAEDFEDQELMILPIKQQFEAQRAEKINSFLSGYQSVASQQQLQSEQKISPQEQLRIDALIEEGRNNVKTLVSEMVDKKWNGFLYVSQEMAADIEASILDNPCPIIKEGKVVGYDLKKATRIAIASNERYFKALLRASGDISRTEGWDEFVNKRNKPSKENTATAQNPETKTKGQVIGQHSDEAYGKGLSSPRFE